MGLLNKEKISLVCCTSQAKSVLSLLNILNEEEMSIYKRGRNAKVSNIPKNAKQSDYHMSTGLESLFGFLYMSNKTERLIELFELIINSKENNKS